MNDLYFQNSVNIMIGQALIYLTLTLGQTINLANLKERG